MFKQIAIDGTSGSGKSTLAKALSQELGYLYVNTGYIFRGLAWYSNKHTNLTMEECLMNISKYKNFIFDKNRWIYNGKYIPESELINKETTKKSSKIAQLSAVREYVLLIEKELAKHNDVIMDGRDIGTQIFPNAFLKIFLTATIETRSKRRYKELKEKKLLDNRTYEDIKQDIIDRDKQDSERAIAPLIKADDAIEIRGDDKSVAETVAIIKEAILNKQKII